MTRQLLDRSKPYQTKQMYVPVPLLELEVMQLCKQYHEFVEGGSDPEAPPSMLEPASREALRA